MEQIPPEIRKSITPNSTIQFKSPKSTPSRLTDTFRTYRNSIGHNDFDSETPSPPKSRFLDSNENSDDDGEKEDEIEIIKKKINFTPKVYTESLLRKSLGPPKRIATPKTKSEPEEFSMVEFAEMIGGLSISAKKEVDDNTKINSLTSSTMKKSSMINTTATTTGNKKKKVGVRFGEKTSGTVTVLTPVRAKKKERESKKKKQNVLFYFGQNLEYYQ